MNRIRVALNPPRRVHEFCTFARAIAACVSEDPLLSPPPSLLATLGTKLVALDTALVAVETRRVGAATERKARQREVLASLQRLQAYVQSLASTLPANEAAVVVRRAGMDVKDAKGPSKSALRVKQGPTSGSAHAYARAATTRASYEWQYAPEGGAWVSLPRTVRADARLDGLVPGTTYSLRVRNLTKDGTSDWLGPVTFRVE